MKKIIILCPALLLVLGGFTWLVAGQLQRRSVQTAQPPAAMQTGTPTIGAPTITPNIITMGTSTPVTVAVPITDARLIPESVNLLRVNATGSPTVLGIMKDDGLNGDVAAGDKIFTARVTLNEPQAGEARFQVSAAFRGILRRVTSSSVALPVHTLFYPPTQDYVVSIPPTFASNDSKSPIDGPQDPLTPLSSNVFTGARSDNELDKYYITAFSGGGATTTNQWLSLYDRRLFPEDRIWSTYLIAGIPGVLVTTPSEGRLSVFILINNKVYAIGWPNYSAGDSVGLQTFFSFLSSWQPR